MNLPRIFDLSPAIAHPLLIGRRLIGTPAARLHFLCHPITKHDTLFVLLLAYDVLFFERAIS